MKNFWNRKSQAAKKWRSRAWLIDPKVTKITIIKNELNSYFSEKHLEFKDLNLEELVSSLLFPIRKTAQLLESGNQGAGALLDMEHTYSVNSRPN